MDTKPKKGKKSAGATPSRASSITVKAKISPAKVTFKPKTTSDSTAYFKNKASASRAAGERHLASGDKSSSQRGMGEFAKQSYKDASKNLKASASYQDSAKRQSMKGAVGKDDSGYATKIKAVTLKKR